MPQVNFHSVNKIEVSHRSFAGSDPAFHTLTIKVGSDDGSVSEITLFTSDEPTALIAALKLTADRSSAVGYNAAQVVDAVIE